MSRIHDSNRGYSLLKIYVDWCTRRSFSCLKVKGLENIPSDGAVILSPNHCNTLMDALVVLSSINPSVGFGARADVFKKPGIAKVLRFLRMMPLARQRDGLAAVSSNDEIFDEIVDCIGNGVPFCMFSEGTHRARRSLLPLKKGIYRVATRAAVRLGKPVYIVPAGIEYEDYFHYMRKATVSYGEPIRIGQDANPVELLATLKEKMSELITYFPDDENYEAAEAAWKESIKPHYSVAGKALRAVLGAASLPVFAVSALLCWPMWVAAIFLKKMFKDRAWDNTMRFASKLALLPLMLIAAGIPAFVTMPWYLALALLVAICWSHSVFYGLMGWYRKLSENL